MESTQVHLNAPPPSPVTLTTSFKSVITCYVHVTSLRTWFSRCSLVLSCKASCRSLARLELMQDAQTTIYDVIRHVPETPTHSLLKWPSPCTQRWDVVSLSLSDTSPWAWAEARQTHTHTALGGCGLKLPVSVYVHSDDALVLSTEDCISHMFNVCCLTIVDWLQC